MTQWAFSNHHMLGLPTDVQHLGRSTETTGRTDGLPWKLKITSTWHKYIDSWALWLKQCYIDWNQLVGEQTGQISREECGFTTMFAHPELIWFTPDSPANATPSTENLCPQKVLEGSGHFQALGRIWQTCRNLCLGGRFHISADFNQTGFCSWVKSLKMETLQWNFEKKKWNKKEMKRWKEPIETDPLAETLTDACLKARVQSSSASRSETLKTRSN